MAVALEGKGTVAIDAPWQADTLGAVHTSPANLAGAGVGLQAVALTRNARWLADGIPAVVHLIGVARQAPHVAVPVADVVAVILKCEGHSRDEPNLESYHWPDIMQRSLEFGFLLSFSLTIDIGHGQ